MGKWDLRYVIQFRQDDFELNSYCWEKSNLLWHVQSLDRVVMIFRWIANNTENKSRNKPTDDWNGWFHCCTNLTLSSWMDEKSRDSFVYNNQCPQPPNTPDLMGKKHIRISFNLKTMKKWKKMNHDAHFDRSYFLWYIYYSLQIQWWLPSVQLFALPSIDQASTNIRGRADNLVFPALLSPSHLDLYNENDAILSLYLENKSFLSSSTKVRRFTQK